MTCLKLISRSEIIRVESTEAHPGETDLYYERNVRWVRALREAEPAQNSGFSFKENGVYMYTPFSLKEKPEF